MGNLHLVTGHANTPHVTAADHASFHAAVFGVGEYVLNRGSKFATTTVTNNTIRVADGDLLFQGRHIRLNEGSYVDLTISNGTQGYLRYDLIVARYTKDSTTGIEDCNLVVIRGTSSSKSPKDPEYNVGDIINDHVLIADMPLYRVPLDGLNVQTLVPLFTEATLVPDDSVTYAKIREGAVTTSRIAEGAVSTSRLADESVTAAKIKSGATYSAKTVSLTVSGWADNAQTVSVSGVTASNLVLVSAAPASYVEYAEANVRCTGQASGKLTFTCDDVPASALTVNVVIPT